MGVRKMNKATFRKLKSQKRRLLFEVCQKNKGFKLFAEIPQTFTNKEVQGIFLS